MLEIDVSQVSGSVASRMLPLYLNQILEPNNKSLISTSGSEPHLFVNEKIAGLPSYTGKYFAKETGRYCRFVFQLEAGGLEGRYYDNRWLLNEPVIERVDKVLNFDWGYGPNYGRDYVSIHWRGKVKPMTTEEYTLYVTADDGVRFFVNHKMIIDPWGEALIEEKRVIYLQADIYYDMKIEYKDETGAAHLNMEWSSNSLVRMLIPSDQLYHASHIVESPFKLDVVPGAADYPYGEFFDNPKIDRFTAIAGEATTFFVQAKVSKAYRSKSLK